MLQVKDLKVRIEGKEILKGLNIEVKSGEVHVLMGPNGSGKSTLAQSLMGHPNYEISSGSVLLNSADLLEMEPTERSLEGLFLSFQYPSEIPGVSISNFLRMVYNKKLEFVASTKTLGSSNGKDNAVKFRKVSPVKFRKILKEKMEVLDMDPIFMERYLNEGFSGGEKKRMEMLQMLVLEPKIAILDETDSGLDIDALKVVSKAVNKLKDEKNMGVLVITHYTRILNHIEPDFVHVIKNGKIVKSGGKELAEELEAQGYAPFGDSEPTDSIDVVADIEASKK